MNTDNNSNAQSARIPFGKYRGQLVSELSLGYLGYLWEQGDLPGYLLTAVESEIAARIGRDRQYRNVYAVIAEFTGGKYER